MIVIKEIEELVLVRDGNWFELIWIWKHGMKINEGSSDWDPRSVKEG